jgi:hypothetical protein
VIAADWTEIVRGATRRAFVPKMVKPEPRSTTQNGLSLVPVRIEPSQSGAWNPVLARFEQKGVIDPHSFQMGSAAVLIAYVVPQRLGPIPQIRG